MVEPVGEVSVINWAQPRLVYRIDGVGHAQQFDYIALAQFLLINSYNGNLLQPTYKRFNSAYLQNYFCISRTNPSNSLGLDATFSC